jgi:hypothetical protein
VKCPDPRVKVKAGHLEGESLVIGMVETVVDASFEECVAYEFIKDSNERKAKLGKKYKAIETKKLNGHSQLYLNRRKLGQGLSLREWRQIGCWQTEKGGNKCWTVYKDTNLLDNDFPLISGTVLASAITTWMFQALPTDKGTPQCRVMFASRVDIKSSVPTFVMNYLSSNYAKSMIDIRNKFTKTDDEKDSITRELLAKVIKNEQQTYTEEEELAIRKGKDFYERCHESKNVKVLETSDERVKLRAIHLENDSLVIAICETVVDASVEECVAYEFIKDSREKKSMLGKKYKAIVAKKINNHSQLYLNKRSLGVQGMSEREWRQLGIWQNNEDGKVCWTVYDDTERLNKEYPLRFNIVQASTKACGSSKSFQTLVASIKPE